MKVFSSKVFQVSECFFDFSSRSPQQENLPILDRLQSPPPPSRLEGSRVKRVKVDCSSSVVRLRVVGRWPRYLVESTRYLIDDDLISYVRSRYIYYYTWFVAGTGGKVVLTTSTPAGKIFVYEVKAVYRVSYRVRFARCEQIQALIDRNRNTIFYFSTRTSMCCKISIIGPRIRKRAQ